MIVFLVWSYFPNRAFALKYIIFDCNLPGCVGERRKFAARVIAFWRGRYFPNRSPS
jgi:hypothetical protein